jgi:hypothetical protein
MEVKKYEVRNAKASLKKTHPAEGGAIVIL